MVEVDIDELRGCALKLYKYYSEFCKEHGLKHFVCGGGCLGAVRHKGFIPWDDDIDVFMPREDYEKLSRIWGQYGDLKNYTLCRTDKDINYHDCGMLLKDNNTTFINKHSVNEDIHHGYMMDIIPLDGYAPSKISRLKQVIAASVYSLFNAQRLPDNQGFLVRTISGIILGVFRGKRIRYKIWSKAQQIMTRYSWEYSDYITELVTGFRYMKNKYPKYIFDHAITVKFEDDVISIPVGYKQYLRMVYGNYLQLPPEDERVLKHNVVFYDMHNSYRDYKGVKYCVEGDK